MPDHDDLTAPLVPHVTAEDADSEPTPTELYEELKALRAQLERLETQLQD
ncbi:MULTISPECIES: hypothetical protein [unclassified Haladaptatus]|nr:MULTISPECIES: hypothetical protein [unclassified Haladaptatus]